MQTEKRKNAKQTYQKQPEIGGVFCLTCSGNHRQWVKATRNIASQQNKFDFAMSIHTCPEPTVRSDWLAYGPASITFTVLETLTKKETQTDEEFGDDLSVLLALWLEKIEQNPLA